MAENQVLGDNESLKAISKIDVKEMVISAMFIALTFVATAFINIRLPVAAAGGLVHLGNIPLFIAAVLFGKKAGALAGGIGMALFDITSGWTAWAPFTLIIVGLMGYAVGKITEKKKTNLRIVIGMIVALLIKIVGYYIAEIIIFGNWLTPMQSIPGNILQVSVAAVIAFPLIACLKAVKSKIL